MIKDGLAPGDPAVRALAVAGNNMAMELESKAIRSAGEVDLMVRAARVALKYWLEAGAWPEHQMAHYRLSKSLFLAGKSDEALEEALSCLALCKSNGADAHSLFWAFEAVATVTQKAKPSAFIEYLNSMRDQLERMDGKDRTVGEGRLHALEASV